MVITDRIDDDSGFYTQTIPDKKGVLAFISTDPTERYNIIIKYEHSTKTDSKIRKQRAESLYQIDNEKEIRLAHKNPIIKKVYQDFLNSKEKIHLICHTKYSPKKRETKI